VRKPSWYTKRATLAAIYAAAGRFYSLRTLALIHLFLPELHQLTSHPTAPAFLDSLFESASDVENALSEAEVFAQYVARSWVAIAKSSM
jgi:ubiquinone biosynthesis protein COQ9